MTAWWSGSIGPPRGARAIPNDAAVAQKIQTLSGFKTPDRIECKRLQGGDAFDYPIDYWIAVPGTSVLFFSMKAADGRIFDILDRQENVLLTVTLEDFARGNLPG